MSLVHIAFLGNEGSDKAVQMRTCKSLCYWHTQIRVNMKKHLDPFPTGYMYANIGVACADPESFVRPGPTLLFLFF